MTDKEYDLFIVYSSADGSAAKSLMEQLEGRFKIRCCFADRDFLPGIEIAENIAISMEKSDKVLMLMSPEFSSSGWCWHEMHEAFRKYYLEKRRHCVIPVLLEAIPEMPKLLRNFTYIDFKKEADPVEKIHKAFLTNTEEDDQEENAEHQSRPTLRNDWLVKMYNDDFEDSKERIEFFEEETDMETLQTYFNDACKEQDFDLLQTILENEHSALNSTNIFKFCAQFPKARLTQEMIDTVFQKLDKELSYADLKDAYIVVCSNGYRYAVTKFNEKGCQKLINVALVETLISQISPCGEEENDLLNDILEDTKWTVEDKLAFLNTAIQSRNSNIIKRLISLLSRIPFEYFLQMIFLMDEQCCLEVLLKERYSDQKGMQGALYKACVMNMETLAREILKLGIILKPNILRPGFKDGIIKILVQEYPWTLEELDEMKQYIVKTVCQKFLRLEIQKRLADV
ncbi:uncharacterized protein LOC111124178 [Crassostrea virginica]